MASADVTGADLSKARETFARYISAPEEHWDDTTSGRGEVAKLVRALSDISRRDGHDRAGIIEVVLAACERRISGHPPTVYIGGRGGSGSHWLAEMLHDLGPFANVGEIVLPRGIRNSMKRWPPAAQALMVDAVHLIHALRDRPDAEDLAFVNSRGSVHYLTLKQWDPTCLFIHLIRDPRDQCVSVAYRKPLARKLHETHADAESDEEFLRLMIYLNRASTLRTIASPVPPDAVIRYEDLRVDPQPALFAISAAAQVNVQADVVTQVAFNHRAESINAGLSPNKGNLYRGVRRSWRETTSVRQRQFLHAGLADVVDLTDYPLDDCLGTPLTSECLPRDREVSLAPGVVLGEFHHRPEQDGLWQRLDWAAGTVRLPAGSNIRLRCPGGWTHSIRQLDELPDDVLHALCLAGNPDVRDDDVLRLRRHRRLVEIDLGRTPITDTALTHLSGLRDLRGLSVVGCSISRAAIQAFAGSHPSCRIVAGEIWSDAWRGKGWLEDRFIP